MFKREQLAIKYCDQHGIKHGSEEYDLAISVFCAGYSMGQSPQDGTGFGVDSTTLLYGAVQWINDKPVLDGVPYFKTKKCCSKYVGRMEARDTPPGIELRYTIIRLDRATQQ